MKILHLSIIAVLVIGIGAAYGYSSAGFPETHYPPTNDTKTKLLVMNSTEFKEITTGYNYTLVGIDNNWIPKANNYYDFGGARVTFIVWGFDNGTVKGVSFNLDPQLKIKNIFEYNAENPPSGYYSDTCHGCFLGALNSTKSIVGPKNVVESPLQQFKSGIAANDVKCQQDLQLVIKSEDGSPACVKPQTAQKFVEREWGWVMQPINSLKPLLPNRIIGLENDTGVVTLGNQTYYFETPNYTDTAYSNPVQIPFHDVVFTLFPAGFRGGLPTSVGCGNITVGELVTGSASYYWTDAKFSDGNHELLHIFAVFPPCPEDPIPTYFSNHTNPQAGLTFYNGKMKLLVSTNNQTANPLGIEALIEYAPIDMGLGTGPNYHFYLKINSNSTAYLLGYNICGKDFCVKNNNLYILIPKTNIGVANYTTVGLSENSKWNYGDTTDIQLEISPTTDNKTAYFLNIENSAIVP